MSSSIYKNQTLLTDKALSIIAAAKEFWPHLERKYLHYVQIVVPVENDCHAEDFQTLIRQLVNSKQSIGCIDNRSWWNDTFQGGCYIVTIAQESPESELRAVYDLLCISDCEDLEDVRENFEKRLRKIFPKAHLRFCSSVELHKQDDFGRLIVATFAKISNPVFEGHAFKGLERNLKRWALEAVGSDVQTIGSIYLMLHQPYNL